MVGKKFKTKKMENWKEVQNVKMANWRNNSNNI